MESGAYYSELLKTEVSVLRAVAGVSNLNVYPAKGRVDAKLNNNGVRCDVLRVAGEFVERTTINVHCGEAFATQLDAAREVRRRVVGMVGEAAYLAAEQLARPPPSSAAAASTSAAAPSAFAVLGEAQRLKSELRAAEQRAASAERSATAVVREADRLVKESKAACTIAYTSVEEAKAALAIALAMHGKKQRVEEEPQQGHEQVYQPSSLGPPHPPEVHPPLPTRHPLYTPSFRSLSLSLSLFLSLSLHV